MNVSKKVLKSDLPRLDAMSDEQIDYQDIPAMDEGFLQRVQMRYSPGKKAISLRLDRDVLAWLKAQGPGYQSRINAVLRAYYETHRAQEK